MRQSLTVTSRFLLISLTMDVILGETTAHSRRQKLRELAKDLDLKEVYGAALERIKEQGGERARLGMAALMWISYSERSLQPNELSHALAVEIGSTDLDVEKIPSVETILSCCLGLIVIDRESSAARLINFTLQEYLYTCPNLFSPTHSIIAKTCLTYLNFRTIKGISSTLFVPPQSASFLRYSSLYWGVHAKREATRDVVSLALQLFSQIESHISTKLLLVDLISRTGRDSSDIPIEGPLAGFTGLHCASVFGITEVATAFIDQSNCDLNGRDFLGITPLVWAAICGQRRVVDLLLERQTVDPDKPDGCFRRAALSWAAMKGHQGIVGLLLGWATARPDGTDGWWGKTPRVLNKVWGRRYVNPNWLDKYDQTPILLAAKEGHEGVVMLLLGRGDVKSNKQNNDGRTPLHCAALNGHEGVVKLLLERGDVNPDKPGVYGRAPLCCAAKNGHEGVVRILLERDDVSPDKPDRYGRTPLCCAAENGNEGVVKILLKRDDVSPDEADGYGQTPLCCAAQNGHEGAVRMLLERDDVNPNKPDNRGRTPLLGAAMGGREGVVKILLERDDLNPNKPDNSGRTPLHWAARNGNEEVINTLLERGDICPDTI